jgi:hypothetical protein
MVGDKAFFLKRTLKNTPEVCTTQRPDNGSGRLGGVLNGNEYGKMTKKNTRLERKNCTIPR